MIRAACEGDLDALEMLEKACFTDFWNRKSLLETLSDEKSLILVDGAPIRAYFIGWKVFDEAEIARIGVESASRGQRIGENLLRHALEEWKKRGAKSVFLEVRASNTSAQRLYARCDFENIGRRPRYYPDGEDALIWRREWSGAPSERPNT